MKTPSQTISDVSGILALRHVLMEVIESFRAAGLFSLANQMQSALRSVQPKPSQSTRRGSRASTTRGDRRPAKRGKSKRSST